MKTHEVIAAIDNWLKNYDAKKDKSIPEPESVAAIRKYTDALRAMEMKEDIEFSKFPFEDMEISETKQYLNKARNHYIVPTPNVDSYIAKNFYVFSRKDTTDMFPDVKEMLSMLLVEAKQEVGDEINDLITALNQDEWLKANIQIHESIRNLRKVGLCTVARTREWVALAASSRTWVWINALKSGLLNPERIAIFEKTANADPAIIEFFTAVMSQLDPLNLLTDNNFDTLLKAWKSSAQQRQVIRMIEEIISTVNNYNVGNKQNPVMFNQKDFDFLYQLNPSTLGFMGKVIRKMYFDIELTPTIFNDLLHYSPTWQTPAISAHFFRLPEHLITAEFFIHLITASRIHANDPVAMAAAIGRIISRIVNRVLAGEEGVDEYNPAQSTHTASVHKSVSESAKRLLQHYDIKTEVVLKDIQVWVEKQPADPSFKGYSLVLALIESKGTDAFLKTKATEFLKDKQKTVLLQKVGEEGEIFAYWYAEDGYLIQKPLLDMDDALKAKLNFPKAAEKLLEITTENQTNKRLFGDISAFCRFVPPEFRNAAAQKAIARLTAKDRIDFTDPDSQITTAHLLALAWIAIHDEKEGGRKGELKDAENRLLEGLYEIQRGYNFDKQGREKKGGTNKDKYICAAGTFNKVMEKLNGLHPDVEVLVITWDGLSAKLPKVIVEKAVAYLKNNPAAIEAVREAGDFSPIAEKIKAAIIGVDEESAVLKDGLVDEFQSLWLATDETGEQTTEVQAQKAKFDATIDAGLSLGLPKDFWVRNPQFSNENSSSTSSTQVQPAKDVKPQITKIDITFRGIVNTKVPSSPLSNMDITADLMGEIKKAILDHNNIPVSERENTIVKVMFGGEIYKTDNPESSAELRANLKKMGANTCSVMVQILPPKKVEEKQEQATISEPTEKAASSSTSTVDNQPTTTASTAMTTTTENSVGSQIVVGQSTANKQPSLDVSRKPENIDLSGANNISTTSNQQSQETKSNPNVKAKAIAKDIFDEITILRQRASSNGNNTELALLTQTEAAVNAALNHTIKDNLEKCLDLAEKVDGNPSLGKKLVGLLLAFVGVLAIAAGITLSIAATAATLGLAAPLSVPAGVAIASSGAVLAGGGAFLFFNSCRKGLSDKLVKFTETFSDHEVQNQSKKKNNFNENDTLEKWKDEEKRVDVLAQKVEEDCKRFYKPRLKGKAPKQNTANQERGTSKNMNPMPPVLSQPISSQDNSQNPSYLQAFLSNLPNPFESLFGNNHNSKSSGIAQEIKEIEQNTNERLVVIGASLSQLDKDKDAEIAELTADIEKLKEETNTYKKQ